MYYGPVLMVGPGGGGRLTVRPKIGGVGRKLMAVATSAIATKAAWNDRRSGLAR